MTGPGVTTGCPTVAEEATGSGVRTTAPRSTTGFPTTTLEATGVPTTTLAGGGTTTGFGTLALLATCWGTTVTGPGATTGCPTLALLSRGEYSTTTRSSRRATVLLRSKPTRPFVRPVPCAASAISWPFRKMRAFVASTSRVIRSPACGTTVVETSAV